MSQGESGRELGSVGNVASVGGGEVAEVDGHEVVCVERRVDTPAGHFETGDCD